MSKMYPLMSITFTVTDRGEAHRESTKKIKAKGTTHRHIKDALNTFLKKNRRAMDLTTKFTFEIRKSHQSGWVC